MRNQQAGSDGLKVINTHTGHRLRVSCSQLFCWEMMAPAQEKRETFPPSSIPVPSIYVHVQALGLWASKVLPGEMGISLFLLEAQIARNSGSSSKPCCVCPFPVSFAPAGGPRGFGRWGLPLLGFPGVGTVIHPCHQLLSSRRPSLLPNHIRTAFSIRNNCSLYSVAVLIPGLMGDDRRSTAAVWEDWSLANEGCTAPGLCKPQREQIAAVQAT